MFCPPCLETEDIEEGTEFSGPLSKKAKLQSQRNCVHPDKDGCSVSCPQQRWCLEAHNSLLWGALDTPRFLTASLAFTDQMSITDPARCETQGCLRMGPDVCDLPSIGKHCVSVHQEVVLFLVHVFTVGTTQQAALRPGLYTGSLISCLFFQGY